AALKADPWLTAEGPPCTREELIALEDSRVEAKMPEVSILSGASMLDIIESVAPLARDVVSSGYDAALSALARQVPMHIHEYASGTPCFTWITPEKWTCQEAF